MPMTAGELRAALADVPAFVPVILRVDGLVLDSGTLDGPVTELFSGRLAKARMTTKGTTALILEGERA